MKHYIHTRKIALTGALLALALSGVCAQAQVIGVWTGAYDARWPEAQNWQGGNIPGVFDSGTNPDGAIFAVAAPSTNIAIASGWSLANITFSAGAGAYTIGNTGRFLQLVTLGGQSNGVRIDSGVTSSQVFAPAIKLRGVSAYTFENNAASSDVTLTFNAGVSLSAATILYLAGSNTGANVIKGVISTDGSSQLWKTGTGTWTLDGANTYHGGTTISGGTLVANNGTALGIGTVDVLSGGNLQVGGTSTVNLTLAAGKNLTVASGGKISLSLGDTVTGDAAILTIADGAIVDLGGSGWDYNLTYTLFSGFTTISIGDSAIIENFGSSDYTADIDSSGVLSFTAVPEAAASAMVGALSLTLCAMLVARRRRA